eukprot:TRINITY_DN1311_c0_g1_i2.p1 TRINITY_DN1311_c0_g1~~TRINITY_DN1311_c0_g1_i2.p1  ORF type:complete len:645 (+),score=100.34 TRINITY_DN1311_c0_g1_i2:29-1936(+)
MEGVWNSRRSAVIATQGIVAASQPLAAQAGISVLQRGGNAADACVAAAAALNVTEATGTGIGGDCFCLYFDARTGKVSAINGSGRAPAALTISRLVESDRERTDVHGKPSLVKWRQNRQSSNIDNTEAGNGDSSHSDSNAQAEQHNREPKKMLSFSPHAVTVPGAAAGWVDTITKFGSGNVTMEQVLAPAISLAENGFPVSAVVAHHWDLGVPILKQGPHADEMLIDGRAPREGEIATNPTLAATFRELAAHGRDGFYKGRVAEAIIELLHSQGNLMSLEDLANHTSTFEDPISIDYKGVRVYESAPNGQGITALMALQMLKQLEQTAGPLNQVSPVPGSADHLHRIIETLRLAFVDARYYVADSASTHVPVSELLSDEYARRRVVLFDPEKANSQLAQSGPFSSSDTVYLCAVDKDGNACSFINSNYQGFGSGLIPKGCGFTLQNRGIGFSLREGHPNALAPNKRPYHTIIPGMVTRLSHSAETGQDGAPKETLLCPFGVMGGFMQPQGHVQVLLNMFEYGMNPQQALDAPRICILRTKAKTSTVAVEEGISPEVVEKLREMGHQVVLTAGWGRSVFGRGQIVSVGRPTLIAPYSSSSSTSSSDHPTQGPSQRQVLWGGSDPRADGAAMPLLYF